MCFKIFNFATVQIKYRYDGNIDEAVCDILSCVKYLSKSKKPIYLIGWSMGGACTIQAAASKIGKKYVKGVISLAGTICRNYKSIQYISAYFNHAWNS
jgi:dienelactone hydrolase